MDLGYALSQPFFGLLTLIFGVTAAILSFAWLPGLAVRPVVSGLSPLAQPLIGFFVFDLIIY